MSALRHTLYVGALVVCACLVTMPLAAYNLKAPIASQPALLTSIGQSADVEMAKALMTRAKNSIYHGCPC